MHITQKNTRYHWYHGNNSSGEKKLLKGSHWVVLVMSEKIECLCCGVSNLVDDFDPAENDLYCRLCKIPFTDEFVNVNFSTEFYTTYRRAKDKNFIQEQEDLIPYTQGAYKIEVEKEENKRKISAKETKITQLKREEQNYVVRADNF